MIQIANRAKSAKRNHENRHDHALRIVWIFIQHLVQRRTLVEVLEHHFVDICSDENEIGAAEAKLRNYDEQIDEFRAEMCVFSEPGRAVVLESDHEQKRRRCCTYL
jgi:hypothetical protein